jgi:hypothetical protein
MLCRGQGWQVLNACAITDVIHFFPLIFSFVSQKYLAYKSILVLSFIPELCDSAEREDDAS